MILSINSRETNENELLTSINSETLNFNSKIVRNIHPEPIMIFKYDKPESNFWEGIYTFSNGNFYCLIAYHRCYQKSIFKKLNNTK